VEVEDLLRDPPCFLLGLRDLKEDEPDQVAKEGCRNQQQGMRKQRFFEHGDSNLAGKRTG
jgi:hypothetical protein